MAPVFLLAGCSAARPPAAEIYPCEVVSAFPHDTNAFTQGLAYCEGQLYEGTGLNGRSSIRRVELATGRVLQQYDLPWKYFGEGITLWGDKLIQLTWTSGTGFLYDRRSFRLLSSFSYPTAGWGLTHDGTRLIMSDGSATLSLLEPDTFAQTGCIRVTDGGAAVSNLNELEFIRGEIWANVWGEYRIARICAASGRVLSWIDISCLMSPLDRLLAGSPNGIACDAENDRIFITGKRWPRVFEIGVKTESRLSGDQTCELFGISVSYVPREEQSNARLCGSTLITVTLKRFLERWAARRPFRIETSLTA